MPGSKIREDIGDRWSEEDSDRLHSWGYLAQSGTSVTDLSGDRGNTSHRVHRP